MPWYIQIVYLEGLEQEFYDPDADEGVETSEDENLTEVETLGATVLRIGA